ncbi:IclR family transcriptional regulator [Brevibacillus humidisoli]|uniref:IclR family transcriptional regulator n=1 Tax=Brevibacillus humidisoli TaxID=2895522 RepID=UPI001E28C0B4|nr:IclR family transcriptional regulator [Brevibacillus humidisoli]UFJ42702.1 IclR family transcriptional regulator [Brevibacillus humidisoli]
MEKESMVKSVDRALQVVHLVSTKKEGFGVTELARQIDLNKSSVYRILSTLATHGYVEQDQETGRYKLGYKVLELSAKLLDSIDLRAEARPYLKELESLTNEVIHLVVYDQGEVVYIEKLEGNEMLRMHSQVGKRAPMHCTSVGKVILAHLPPAEMERIVEKKGLPRHTERTITQYDTFQHHLQEIKQKGYALDLEENEQGITCIAAPIFGYNGKVTAAISISGPTIRMTDQRLSELKEKIMEVGRKISERLGYRG